MYPSDFAHPEFDGPEVLCDLRAPVVVPVPPDTFGHPDLERRAVDVDALGPPNSKYLVLIAPENQDVVFGVGCDNPVEVVHRTPGPGAEQAQGAPPDTVLDRQRCVAEQAADRPCRCLCTGGHAHVVPGAFGRGDNARHRYPFGTVMMRGVVYALTHP